MIALARFSSRPGRWSRAAWIAASVSLFVAVVYIVVNFLVDMAQAWADPRIRTV